MKKYLILLLCLTYGISNAQTGNFDTLMFKMFDKLIVASKAKTTAKVVVMGFQGNGKEYKQYDSYLKTIAAIKMNKGKFKLIDQSAVDQAKNSSGWNLSKKSDPQVNEAFSQALFEKAGESFTLILYGEIEDMNDKVKITLNLVKNESFTNVASNTEMVDACEQTDKLLGKAVTHKKMVEEVEQPKVAQQSAAPAQSSDSPKEVSTSTTTREYVVKETTTDQKVTYRGSTDPLKGLNVAQEKKTMQVGNYYALIVGIDNYKGDWAKLSNAVNDAKALEDLLKKKYKFDGFRSLYNDQATRENIIKELETLIKSVKENDNVLIYYSGHGDFKQELNKGFWVPIDATNNSTSQCISNNDIQTYLGGIKSKHTLLISDACFSGDIFRGKTMTVPFEETDKYYTKVYNLASRKAITSGGIEPVMDGGKDGHSVFAYYLLKSLSNNNNNMYDASQLFDAIKIPVVNNSSQSPNFQPIKDTGDEGGQFIFIKK
jgi:hypothetical protein